MTISGKWAIALIVALVLSVCANVFVAGHFVGRMGDFRGGERAPEAFMERGLKRFLRTLPGEARELAMQRFRDNRPEIMTRMRTAGEARMRAVELLRADPVDRAALDAALLEARQKQGEAMAFMQTLFVDTMLEMPPEVRRDWQPPQWDRRGGPPPR